MVRVPVRAGPGFAAALKRTWPLPVPLAPAVIVSHESLLVAVQLHDTGAVTEIAVPEPPAALMDWLLEFMETVHEPAWLTVNVWPATVMVPVRALPVLAAAEIVTLPLPLPAAAPTIPSHDTLLTAVHAQPAGA